MKFKFFLEKLKSLDNTYEILAYIYEYFKNNVSYNYDQLQVVKFNRQEEPLLVAIREYVNSNKNYYTNSDKMVIMSKLDEAFMKIEGRPLSDTNKKEWFKDFGKIIYHDAQPEKNGIIKIKARPAYEEPVGIVAKDYSATYEDGMLIDGVCGDYANWIMQILTLLGKKCFYVTGKGTTGHAWNLIYLDEEKMWVNFDMTMVRFYLDNWSKEYGEPENWISASNEKMFELQPCRVVEEIKDINGTQIFKGIVTRDNQRELDEQLFNFSTENIKYVK